MASIEVDDHQILAALQQLQRLAGDLRPALDEIGVDLVESTKRRFETTSAPDGSEWALNSVLSTLLYKEGDRPLTGETGVLMDTINYSATANLLEVGSPMEYAAMQQFGGTKAEFPHLWGDIPARPFLGLSEDDRSNLLAILQRHIDDAWR
jgi:phage virion morphogenesis protein